MSKKRPALFWILLTLILVIGIGAVISGTMLFLSPNGNLMKMPVDVLEDSPFSDYLVPGIILFFFVGLLPLITAYGLIKTPEWKWANTVNPSKNTHWAWAASWASGIVMLIWIGVETIMLGYISFLQPVIAAWGLTVIVLTLIPSVKNNLLKQRTEREY